jgi:hypothetical protein
MSTLLITGSIVGAVLGIFHALGVYARRIGVGEIRPRVTPTTRLRAGYAALWTAVLWTAFGSYVLILWLVSVPIWIGHRVATALTSAGA